MPANAETVNRPWPVLVLTGALGSGKTTVLRHLLSHAEMSGMAVLINELGEIGLDHQLVERIDETIVLMRSGCLCCSIRGDLPQTLRHLERRWLAGSIKSLKGVVIETTGIADPGPILATLAANPLVNQAFRLWLIATTVDATFGESQLDTRPEVVRQAAAADVFLITKTDLIGTSSPSLLSERLEAINPFAASFVVLNGALDVPALLRQGTADQLAMRWPRGRRIPNVGAAGDGRTGLYRHEKVGSLAFQARQPIDWASIQAWLGDVIAVHGRHLLRLKAILNVIGEARPVVVHGVHDTFYPPELLETWPDRDRFSRLVLIIDDFETHAPLILQSASNAGLWTEEAGEVVDTEQQVR